MHIGILSIPSNFHCQKWAKALVKAGAKVTVFSLEPGTIEGVKVIHIPPKIIWKGRYRYPAYFLASKQLKQFLYDVDILHPLHLTPFGTWALLTDFKPIISAAIGADVLEYPPIYNQSIPNWDENLNNTKSSILSSFHKRLKWWFYRKAVKQVCDKSDFITADNLTLIKALKDWFGVPEKKIMLLRWGIDPTLYGRNDGEKKNIRQNYKINNGDIVVLFPRGCNYFYGADIFLEAATQLLFSAAGHKFHFILLGAGYAIDRTLGQKASMLMELSPQFTFINHQLSPKEMADLYSISQIMINIPAFDGYSSALAEARYNGLIPIVNQISAHLEIIEEKKNGFYLDNNTPSDLIEKLNQVAQLPVATVHHIAEKNRKWIEEHGLITKSATEFLQLCERVRRI